MPEGLFGEFMIIALVLAFSAGSSSLGVTLKSIELSAWTYLHFPSAIFIISG
jgi:hypothetical protein